MSEITLQRQWRLLYALHGKRFGLPVRKLLDEVEVSRPTLYRYLRILRTAGFPIESELQNGEARYRLHGKEAVPSVRHTARQMQVLRLARRLLAPLEGTKMVREFDALVPRKAPAPEHAPTIDVASAQPAGQPRVIAAIERAMVDGVRIAFTYAATHGEPARRTVDPLALYVRDGLYLNGFDVAKNAVRTFKIARMSAAEVLKDKAESHPEYDEARVFAHAAKIWDGPLVDVVVRISPRCARFVSEWPLVSSQQLEYLSDGAVLVRARVSGTVETMRWVLRWGQDAQVLEPAELRTAVVNELLRAVAAYTGAVVSDS